MQTTTVDLYAILGVGPDEATADIRTAYRHLARRYHPDLGGDERRMMAINKAWAILRDPERREAYDRQRSWSAPGAAPHEAPPPPVGRASGSVLDFGRYAGWSVGQLAVHDPDYLLWLERTPIGRPMRHEIDAALSMARPTPEPVSRPAPRRRAFAGIRG